MRSAGRVERREEGGDGGSDATPGGGITGTLH